MYVCMYIKLELKKSATVKSKSPLDGFISPHRQHQNESQRRQGLNVEVENRDYLIRTTHQTWERSKGTDFWEPWRHLQPCSTREQSFRKRQ